ncbi:hydroxymethylpyrimidine/phosphomethylpyrimidine kinase [Synergistales bacterium]|nr:hydroxymethylpyrimidine/phosphomethylpyrimidine kinase [Synergistales bacterium]
MKAILTIAGSDCSGGAGIQADIKTFSAHGLFGMSVVISVVAENTSRVISIQDISSGVIADQMDAIFEDIEVSAIKVGMLSGIECMKAVAVKLRQYKPALTCHPGVVVDPVMYAKNGCALMAPDSIDTLISEIIPLADVLTPNIPEAEKIAGLTIKNLSDMELAARRVYTLGETGLAVLVKGGHASGEATDVLFDGASFSYFNAPRVDTKNTHGTGCTMSSAIASNLALGFTVKESVARAKVYVTTAIKHSLSIGKGNGPTHHFYDLYRKGLDRDEQ